MPAKPKSKAKSKPTAQPKPKLEPKAKQLPRKRPAAASAADPPPTPPTEEPKAPEETGEGQETKEAGGDSHEVDVLKKPAKKEKKDAKPATGKHCLQRLLVGSHYFCTFGSNSCSVLEIGRHH